jgi:sialic acid synthase SpsE
MKINIIAEIGWNFMGDLTLAKKMISSASQSGADTCKFQYWNPQNLKPGDWDTDGRRQIYEKAKLDDSKINDLKSICSDNNVNFLLSVFSIEDAKKMYELGMDSIKIPSHESYNIDLHKFCISNFKNVYSSLGACSEIELNKLINLYKDNPNKTYVNAMHCVSSYPCKNDNLNLPRLSYLKKNFQSVGLSDHTGSIFSGSVAVGIGATVIEKHFTTDNNLPGRDNKFALDPDNFKTYCNGIREAQQMMQFKGLDSLDVESDIIENYRGRWG